MKVSLLMVTAERTTKEYDAAELPLVIGRGHDCRLRVPVDSVSRHHCELAENDDEELVIKDLKSSNGTYVNRERIKERELVPGDLLSIGPVVFVVKIDGHPKEIDADTAFTKGKVSVGGGAEAMIDGMPTWGGTTKPGASPKEAGGKPKGGLAFGGKDDEGFEALLRELRESDDDEPKPKK